MPKDIPGIHHITAIGSDPGRNYSFYTDVLGLRLVKQSVNQDDVSVYHLFYADRTGSPGTSITFFPYPGAQPGRVGTGQATRIQFLIPREAVTYWIERLQSHEIPVNGPFDRFDEAVIQFEDPDGLPLELVGRDGVPAGDPPDGPVDPTHAIRGFYGATLTLTSFEQMEALLETMGFEPTRSDHDRQRFEADGDLGYVVDLIEDPQAPRGQQGAGTVHHVAFQVRSDEQDEWRNILTNQGLRPTEIIDRKWFKSVYARTHSGVLFEYATKEPGYAVDEDVEELGNTLMLPEWLENDREEIEAGLPEIAVDGFPN
ncbi:MAG: VOC family protein [Halobacteriaceae archaeon]